MRNTIINLTGNSPHFLIEKSCSPGWHKGKVPLIELYDTLSPPFPFPPSLSFSLSPSFPPSDFSYSLLPFIFQSISHTTTQTQDLRLARKWSTGQQRDRSKFMLSECPSLPLHSISLLQSQDHSQWVSITCSDCGFCFSVYLIIQTESYRSGEFLKV